jgi:ankyrin repeat protein
MALLYASNYGHTATVQALISTGADVHLQDKVRNSTGHIDGTVARVATSHATDYQC